MKLFIAIKKRLNVANLLNLTITDLSPISFTIKSDRINLVALKELCTLMS